MEIVNRKDSKLLGRSELQVLFAGQAGAISRKDAVKEVARALNTIEGKVTLVKLSPEAGSRNLVGWFHVYESEDGKKGVEQQYLATRLLTKEEKEALKAAKKKAETAAAAAAAAAPAKKK